MQISKVRIRNFRSVKSLEMDLGPTTVLIGPNNTLARQRYSTPSETYLRAVGDNAGRVLPRMMSAAQMNRAIRKTLPPVTVEIVFEEPIAGNWHADMVATLEDIVALTPDGRNILTVRVTCSWSAEKEAFDPVWEFLDAAGQPLSGRAQRATNLTGFFRVVCLCFGYLPLRDALDGVYAARRTLGPPAPERQHPDGG